MTTDTIRANAERVAKTLFVPHAAASDEAVIAIAEGLLAGIAETLMARLGMAEAHRVLQRPPDILERVMLDMRRGCGANHCGNG